MDDDDFDALYLDLMKEFLPLRHHCNGWPWSPP